MSWNTISRRLRIAFVVVVISGGQTAFAADKVATVVRGAGAGSDRAAGFVAHFVREEFANSERRELIDLEATLGTPNHERITNAFAVADEMLEKGRAAYESLDLDPAVEHLNTALSKYEKNAAYVTDFKKVADGLMLLGATHILRGEEKTGRKRLSQAIAIYPEVEPDPRVFNPGMREVFEDAGKALVSRPTGDMSLTSNPSYAEVYIDGRFVGVTPLAVADVTEGRHYLRVVKDGYRPWGKLLDVAGGSEASDTANLKATNNFDDYDNLAEQAVGRIVDEVEDPSLPFADAADQLGVLLNIDFLFVCEVTLDGERVELNASMYDLNRRERVKSAGHNFAYDSAVETYAKEVRDFFTRKFGREIFGPKPGEPGYGAESGAGLAHAGSAVCAGMLCTKFKILVVASTVGAGALLMGVGGIMWGLAKGDNNVFGTTAQLSPEFTAVKDGGVLKAGLGDGFFFTGAAAALVGTILILAWRPAPSAEQVVSGSKDFALRFVPLDGGAMMGARLQF